jgi:hypothetical protein
MNNKDRDPIARILIAGSLVLNGILSVREIWRDQTPPHTFDIGLIQQIEGLSQDLDETMLALCANEAVLKAILGEKILKYDDCLDEHERWWQEFNEPDSQPSPRS